MPRLARGTSPVGLSTSPTGLSLVADVAARVARAPAAEGAIAEILELVRTAFDARDCTLWRPTAAGLPAVWRAAAPGADVADSGAPLLNLESAGAGVVAVTVRYAGRDLAVLSVRLGAPISADDRLAMRAVADTLGPLLATDAAPRTPPDAMPSVTGHDGRFIQKIVDSLPIGLYVIDREYRIQAWNRKRETGMQGVAREEAVGRTIFEILHRQSAATLRAEFDEVFSTGRIWQTEVDTLAGAEQRCYRLSKVPMRLDDSRVTHVITIGEDITEQKRSQERLGQAEKLAAVGQLAAGVMHEINNPLATIGVCAEQLSRRIAAAGVPEEARAAMQQQLDLIWHEVDRCQAITTRLLDFSRPRPLTREPVSLHAVLDQTLLLLAHHSRFRDVTVVRAFAADRALTVRGNGESLIQVFMAILLNAADAMKQRRRVTITTHERSATREALVEIADEGSGIARSDLPRVFEPFFTTKPPGKGTGLGLSICYGIVSDHGGRIDVESTYGEGSIFRVTLPLEEPA